MVFGILVIVAVAALFVAATLWGEDSRVDFTDPRRREPSRLDRRLEIR